MKKDKTGGELLTQLNEGKSHEENIYGGIPLGENNRAEEGETVVKGANYVLSDAPDNTISKTDIESLFLPKDLEGLTWAAASKKVNDSLAESPNDPIIKRTVQKINDSLMVGNENKRLEREQALENMQQTQDNIPPEEPMTEEPILEEPQQFFLGGMLDPSTMAGASNIQGGLGALGGATQLIGLSQGQGASTNKASSIAGGAMSGAMAGAGLGIPGIVGGAVLGAGAGWLGSNKASEAQSDEQRNQAYKYSSQYSQEGYNRMGGEIKQYRYGGPEEEGTINDDELTRRLSDQFIYKGGTEGTINDALLTNQLAEQFQDRPGAPTDYYNTNPALFETRAQNPYSPDTTTQNNNASAEVPFQPKGEHPLQYAGIVGSGLSYLQDLKDKPDVAGLRTLDNTYDVNKVNESQLVNNATQAMNTELRGLSEIGLTPSQLAAAQMGTQLNYTRGISDAFLNAEVQNRTIDQAREQFDVNRDTFNIGQRDKQEEINAMNKGVSEDLKRTSRNQFIENLGQLGLELTRGRQVQTASGGYDTMGKYTPYFGKEKDYKRLKGMGLSDAEINKLLG